VIKSTKSSRQAGRIVRTKNAEVFPLNTVLPVPSEDALKDSIGKGGNGTVTYIYHKRREFAVKKTHFRSGEVDILHSLDHKNIVPLIAVMMGEEDPARPHRYYCYHFYPRMSGDVQSYLTRLGQGALSNVLMKHKDSPSMLQLVVDNVKHILGCVLRGVEYLHGNNIVHNDIKPSNFLVSLQCECDSPITCKHSQRFAVKIGDFDSAMPVAKLQKSSSLVRQLYRTHPIGTPGYRPVEYVLAGTRSRDELRSDVVTSGDMWSFGCSVLKMFLSHSGPSSQREMSFLHLWGTGCHPWSAEEKRAKEILKVELLQRVYPNWIQLVEFVEDCMKVVPTERARAGELLQHQFFTS
jgi:serine/threonine protein kinase